MKRALLAACAIVVTMALTSFDAEAKRLGGGSSIGMSRGSSVMQRSAPPAPAAPAQQAAPRPATPPAAAPMPAPQPSGMSRWLGPIAGLAAGIGLAALLSHFGLGEGMASVLMMVLLAVGVVFLFRLLFRRPQPQPAMQYAGGDMPSSFEASAPAAAAPVAAANVPAGFDVDGFLRHAKVNFIRLQAANDAGNLDDLREFTTPEFFAETKLQINERGGKAQTTDVMQLEAQLLDLTTEEKRYIASVRFHGLIREEADAAPENFDEVWHLTKPVDGSSGWMVAGIQQFQ